MSIKFQHITIIITLLAALLTGCTAEVPDRAGINSGSRFILRVPAAGQFASRGGDNDGELKFTSLFFFAYPADASKTPVIVSLPLGEGTPPFQEEYQSYTVDLTAGDYRFYLCANIYDAAADVATLPQSASALEEEVYNLPAGYQCAIPAAGLPMSATHTDLFIEDSDGTRHSLTGTIYHYDGNGVTLYAPLTFLFSKITLVPFDALGNPAEIENVRFTNVSETEPVIANAAFTSYGSTSLSLTDAGDEYSYYLPERYVAAGSEAMQSALTFNIGEKEITLPLGETGNVDTANPNAVPAEEDLRSLVRGTEYTYTLNTLVDITLQVTPWSPDIISSSLKGPVYLHVESQEYEVTAGTITPIWFQSDAEKVYIESPGFTFTDGDGKLQTVNLYDYSVDATNDTIRVWVNTDIRMSQYDEIKASIQAGEGKYDYFHIVAGPIHKRIRVTPLTLEYYLNVSPVEIPIDVSLRISSGEYSGRIPVTIRTNYPQVKVSIPADGGWDAIPASESGALAVMTPAGTAVTELAPGLTTMVADSAYVNYYVKFDGLNSGYKIWKDDATFTVNVTGIDDEGNEQLTVPVTVTIVPLTLNYKIHFKVKDNNWSLPHIYIYQCLEFPADWPGTYNGVPLASKPIGYQSAQYATSYFAALEYSFTGAIAFRGWDVAVNHNELYYSNGTVRPFDGYSVQGFYIFNGASDTWVVEKQETASLRYSYLMDFCKEHRDYVTVDHADFPGKYCPLCAWDPEVGSVMNRLWPGIMMKPEGDGWYEFELTGIATPGKTLIMFCDTHGGNSVNRYPGSSEVGIPLFDYPSKEGWLLYNGVMSDRVNNQFSPVKP